jgi:hypothetical protein
LLRDALQCQKYTCDDIELYVLADGHRAIHDLDEPEPFLVFAGITIIRWIKGPGNGLQLKEKLGKDENLDVSDERE